MRGIHPHFARRAFALAALALGLAGCQGNNQTASINPFLSPDRVPPPATRAVAPGTAQPYYPGDPLPTMQSTTGAPTPPSAPAPINAITPVAAASEPGRLGKSTLAYSNERLVSIPTDSGVLRFEQAAAPAEPAPFTPSENIAPIMAASNSTVPVNGLAQTPVAPASFQQPVNEPFANATPSFITPKSPWRTPQIAPEAGRSIAPPQRDVIQASMVAPATSPWTGTLGHPAPPTLTPPIAVSPATMDVRLRAVPSPEPETVGAPRIRIPSNMPTTQTFVMPDGSIQEVTYTPIEAPHSSGALQTVGITPLGPQTHGARQSEPQLASANDSQPSQPLARRDGFRRRGSAE